MSELAPLLTMTEERLARDTDPTMASIALQDVAHELRQQRAACTALRQQLETAKDTFDKIVSDQHQRLAQAQQERDEATRAERDAMAKEPHSYGCECRICARNSFGVGYLDRYMAKKAARELAESRLSALTQERDALKAVLLQSRDAALDAFGDWEDCEDCTEENDGCRIHKGPIGERLGKCVEAAEDLLGPCPCGHTRKQHDDEYERRCVQPTCPCKSFRLPRPEAARDTRTPEP